MFVRSLYTVAVWLMVVFSADESSYVVDSSSVTSYSEHYERPRYLVTSLVAGDVVDDVSVPCRLYVYERAPACDGAAGAGRPVYSTCDTAEHDLYYPPSQHCVVATRHT